MRIRLQRVRYMPAELEPGVLYASEEFKTAAHLCPCGCGSKVRTPLGPAEWALEETAGGPTLRPSVGNWQRACRSHYWIEDGWIVWAGAISSDEVLAGRRAEEGRRRAYYEQRHAKRRTVLQRLAQWIGALFRRR